MTTRGRPGRYLRYARRKARLTQAELASRAGVPQPVIARIESGASMPRFDTLDRLLNVCGFSLELAPRVGLGVDRSMIEPLVAATPVDRATTAAKQARAVEDLVSASRRA